MRKLLPALYYLEKDLRLAPKTKIIAVSRSGLTRADYIDNVLEQLKLYLPEDHFEENSWINFSRRLDYLSIDLSNNSQYAQLKKALAEASDNEANIFYLSTPPDLFGAICQALQVNKLVNKNSRIVLEKPLGEDYHSSTEISDVVGSIFSEDNIYRIDHYLGKETVQNLLALRFANVLFEPLWNRSFIDNIQITVAETVGVEGRWGYYNDSGALRDMVQNHLLQLLCLVAMGVPGNMSAESIRAEKIKVLKSLKILSEEEVCLNTVRGQYQKGVISNKAVPGYLEEIDSGHESQTETFVAIRADVHNWRWRGVPFYLRTGKRMPDRYSEIVIQFKEVPHSIFSASANLQANKLVIRLQPQESIQLFKMNKVPGLQNEVEMVPVTLNLVLPEVMTAHRVPEAYERLIYDVMRGDSTLFVHRQEVEAAWRWCDAIQTGWQQQAIEPIDYAAGSWGPQAANELTKSSGHHWNETDLGSR